MFSKLKHRKKIVFKICNFNLDATNGNDNSSNENRNPNSSQSSVMSKSFEKLHSGQRQDVISFLNTSAQGKMILFYYEKHQCLSDNLQSHLCNLLIDRELLFILEQNADQRITFTQTWRTHTIFLARSRRGRGYEAELCPIEHFRKDTALLHPAHMTAAFSSLRVSFDVLKIWDKSLVPRETILKLILFQRVIVRKVHGEK